MTVTHEHRGSQGEQMTAIRRRSPVVVNTQAQRNEALQSRGSFPYTPACLVTLDKIAFQGVISANRFVGLAANDKRLPDLVQIVIALDSPGLLGEDLTVYRFVADGEMQARLLDRQGSTRRGSELALHATRLPSNFTSTKTNMG